MYTFLVNAKQISSRAVLHLLSMTLLLGACSDNNGTTLFSAEEIPPPDPFGDYGTFLSVLPPGSADANLGDIDANPNSLDQLRMYENLAFSDDYPVPGQLRDEDLVPAYFKDATFLPESSFTTTKTVSNGSRQARIGRDEFGVPHIFGSQRNDVLFGTGYATAEDRMFLIDIVRHIGRGRLSDFLGPTSFNYSQDQTLGRFGGYSEQEMQDQLDQLLERFGTDGMQAQEDLESFVAGINQYIDDVEMGAEGAEPASIEYAGLGLTLRKFTGRDVLSMATVVQSLFASGGGNEHRQLQLLQGLSSLFPGDAQKACNLWRDIRQADDPERPNTTAQRFETQSPAVIDETACPLLTDFTDQFPGAALFDPGSLQDRELLVIQDCVEPGMATGADIECPNFGEDVVDDPVTMAAAGPYAMPDLLQWISSDILLYAQIDNVSAAFSTIPLAPQANSIVANLNPGRKPSSEYSEQELAAGRAQAKQTLDGVLLALNDSMFPAAMSNAIVVAGSETENGNPIAAFGPQAGYFSPQFLLEFAQHGGGINARGAAFAGLPYVIIGRGIDHAWSPTASGDDITDIRVLQLCEPDGGTPTRESVHYLYNRECIRMVDRVDEWTAESNFTTPDLSHQRVTRNILRAPDYGPVFATATVSGEPVALAIQRATFFGEVESVRPFLATSRNAMVDPNSFFDIFNSLTGTFNWFYVDADNIAYFNSGLLPSRATGIHPDLPQWGNGDYDWQQTATGRINPDFSFDNFLPLENHPREINPASGYFVNWNNAQAPGFYANDGQTGYGPV
ncbi:MAG: penicillin acylase family protein [Pseudomonadales bacterium]